MEHKYYVELHCVVEVDAASEEEAIEEAYALDTYDLIWEADIVGEKITEEIK